MNLRQAQTTATEGRSLRSATGMRLSGYLLVLAPLVWIGVVILILALFVAIFHSGPLSDLMIGTVLQVFVLLIPLSIALAILRSRLWEIDIIIHRTLVYGTLTGILLLVYAGLVIALQSLLRGILNQNNDVAIVASTL